MSAAHLCVQVFSRISQISEELTFFEAGQWTPETEKALMIKIQELISTVRHCGKSFEVKVNMEVTDLDEAVFLIRKKVNKECEINHQKLSLREIEVLGLIMQGCTNNEIAEKLFISYETVKSHRKHILLKTGAKNTAALINHYHQTFFEKDI
jgi:DNA-binding CsgD family transcriptional regulator